MAIGADYSLRSQLPSPLAVPKGPATPQAKTQGSPFRPFAMNDKAVQSMQNNQQAAGAGAGRVALSSADRSGVSRGRGQQYLADLAEAGANADANASASKTGMMAGIADANAQRAYDNTRANERLSTSGLLEGLRNTSAMERLSGFGNRQDIQEAIRRGQFGLDQMQLDTSPLLAQLLR
jgi:hypothetical protein